MAVLLGNARCDENGNIAGGRAGDQTGAEVCIQNWYSYSWEAVFRPKSGAVANQLALAMRDACNNENIGYDQNQRETCTQLASRNGWNFGKVGTSETDCSALVAACCCSAGLDVPWSMYTGNEPDCLMQTGAFEMLTGSAYTASSGSLKVGDILWKHGHTAIVVGGAPVPDPGPTPDPRKQMHWWYAVRTTRGRISPTIHNLEGSAGRKYTNEYVTDIIVGANDDNGTPLEVKYQVHVRGGSWTDWVTACNFDRVGSYAGTTPINKLKKKGGKPIDAVRIVLKSDCGSDCQYRVRVASESTYYDWQTNAEVDSRQDGYAGEFGERIIRLQIH